MKIGTRKSTMAMAQTEEVARRLTTACPGLDVDIVPFQTRGDADQVSKLDRHGGKGGAFVAEIRQAMREGSLQAAMHSLKDIPGNEETPDLVLAAMLTREAATDALVLRDGLDPDTFFKSQGAGFKIGTNAVRRAAYLRRLFPDAEVIHYRGAADTRIQKLDEQRLQRLPDGSEVGPADALVMAQAGLKRVGQAHRSVYEFSADEMLPAIAQGIVTVECAERDWQSRERLAAIDDPLTHLCADAEREVLWVLNGHCNSPIAGHSRIENGRMRLKAAVIAEDGARLIESEREGPADRPRELGRAIGLDLLKKGADLVIESTAPPDYF
ncbi:MAG: hydroxymethylbilane synthase [Rhodothalassiaceae bacterium]